MVSCMRTKCFFWAGFAVLSATMTGLTQGQSVAVDGTYKIVSGTFTECCGIAGPRQSSLPDQRQSFIRLRLYDDQRLASMAFLGADGSTVLTEMTCGADPLKFSFDFGLVNSNNIFFHVDPGPNGLYWIYSVSNSADVLHIDGQTAFAFSACADIPNRFNHSNVVAVLQPVASIEIGSVNVCWNSVSNRNYQIQFKSVLTTNQWVNLGSPVAGNGSRLCVPDSVQPGDTRRFYQVVTVP